MIALAFVAVGLVCFWLGWKAHDWFDARPLQVEDADVITKPKLTTFGKVWLVSFAIYIGSIWFLDYRTDDKVSTATAASEARQNDANTIQLACLSRTFQDFLSGNEEVRNANTRWRTALKESKRANRRLIYWEEIRGFPRTDPLVQKAARDYVTRTRDFITASDDYDTAVTLYKLPDFEKRCGKVAPRIGDVFYRDIREPQWRAEFTRASR